MKKLALVVAVSFVCSSVYGRAWKDAIHPGLRLAASPVCGGAATVGVVYACRKLKKEIELRKRKKLAQDRSFEGVMRGFALQKEIDALQKKHDRLKLISWFGVVLTLFSSFRAAFYTNTLQWKADKLAYAREATDQEKEIASLVRGVSSGMYRSDSAYDFSIPDHIKDHPEILNNRLVREILSDIFEEGHIAVGYELGNAYKKGEGIPADFVAAREWYKRSEGRECPGASYQLALMAMNGLGEEKDEKRARKIIERVAGEGYTPAQNMLGYMFHTGQGGKESKKLARHWYRQAANKGNKKAMYNLGVSYAQSSKPERKKKAGRCFLQAALQGEKRSLYACGVTLERKGDLDLASRCYEQAALGGYEPAREAGLRLARELDRAAAEA